MGLLFACLMGCSAPKPSPQYIIGVSQCSDDAWRVRMNEEMEQELIFHPELALHIRQAGDNSEIQCQQIDSFIAERVDLLIVSPNEAEEVKPAVSRAYDAGIPVIVADRQVSGEKWTAFIGGDNYAVGQLMAQWLLSIVPEGRPLR
ncbi:MAG: substrate-binding domain-containing protein, partial [Paludibacteraceae bacterium]